MNDNLKKISHDLDDIKTENVFAASKKLNSISIDLKCEQFKVNLGIEQKLSEFQETKNVVMSDLQKLCDSNSETKSIENILYYQEQIKKILNINQEQKQKVLEVSKFTKEEEDKKLSELDKSILELAEKNKKLYERKMDLTNKANTYLSEIEELKKSVLKMRIFNSKKSDELINTFAKNDKEFKNMYKKFNLFQNLLKYRILDIKENDNSNYDVKGYFVDSNNARLKYFPMNLSLEKEDPANSTKRVQEFWWELHEFFRPKILNSKSGTENIEPNINADDYEIVNNKID